jgi:hypothetical protein
MHRFCAGIVHRCAAALQDGVAPRPAAAVHRIPQDAVLLRYFVNSLLTSDGYDTAAACCLLRRSLPSAICNGCHWTCTAAVAEGATTISRSAATFPLHLQSSGLPGLRRANSGGAGHAALHLAASWRQALALACLPAQQHMPCGAARCFGPWRQSPAPHLFMHAAPVMPQPLWPALSPSMHCASAPMQMALPSSLAAPRRPLALPSAGGGGPGSAGSTHLGAEPQPAGRQAGTSAALCLRWVQVHTAAAQGWAMLRLRVCTWRRCAWQEHAVVSPAAQLCQQRRLWLLY